MKRLLNAIVIHCSATPNFKDFNALGIDAMHKARGFIRDAQARRNFNPQLGSIGYHFVIDVNGKTETGRGIEEIGAHVKQNNGNARSIGICLIGTSKFSDEQCAALKQLMLSIVSKISGREIHTDTACMTALKDMGIAVKGHRDYSPDLNNDGVIQRAEWMKTCPGFSVAKWIKSGMDKIEEDA